MWFASAVVGLCINLSLVDCVGWFTRVCFACLWFGLVYYVNSVDFFVS